MAATISPPAQSARLLGLVLLRLFAVVLVLGHHMETPPGMLPALVQPLMNCWQTFGGFGVVLFFVLSGFLVSGLLFSEYRKHGQLSVQRF